MNIAIIGTSKITEDHILALKQANFKITALSSTRQNSKNLNYLRKKFKIKKVFTNWKECINFSKKINNLSFYLTTRIEDNKKILESCCLTKKKIFVEKPIFDNSKNFNQFLKFNKKIFVGYNRIFYSGILNLKKNIKLNNVSNVIVKCPEESKKQFIRNSCHIISILKFIFGDLKIEKKIKNNKFIFCLLRNKKNIPISFYINFCNPDNFSIEIFENKKRYNISPIETVKFYKGLEKKRIGSSHKYFPKNIKIIDEYNRNRFKPGFLNQTKNFKRFLKGEQIFNNLIFAKKIIKLAESITK